LPVSLEGAGELSVSGEYSSLPATYKAKSSNYLPITKN
jgi:hypothetical protein